MAHIGLYCLPRKKITDNLSANYLKIADPIRSEMILHQCLLCKRKIEKQKEKKGREKKIGQKCTNFPICLNNFMYISNDCNGN